MGVGASCFNASGNGNLFKVEAIMKKEGNLKIFIENFKQSAAKLGLGFVLQHYNDPKPM